MPRSRLLRRAQATVQVRLSRYEFLVDPFTGSGVYSHEYLLLGGINRASVGRHLARASALIAAAIVLGALLVFDFAEYLGLPRHLVPTLGSLLIAGLVYAALYWWFDKALWRRLTRVLQVPDLSGAWRCEGRSLAADGSVAFEWTGTLTVVQSWDRLRIRLKTATSTSDSIAAAVLRDEAAGYRLLYNYRNDPNADQAALRAHVGFADVIFREDLQEAEGTYFNGPGRPTYGTMRLIKER